MTRYPLKPWTRASFEVIAHAERHLRDGADFDRRVAHIGFDNAIEIAITTYLGLHPIQREGREYTREGVTKWLANYHTKLEFLAQEAQARGYRLKVPCDEIVYYHSIRNDQYHTGGSGVPEAECLQALRTAALDTFGFLFDVADVEEMLEDWLPRMATPHEQTTARNQTADWLLDNVWEPVIIAGQTYPVSEALHVADPRAYQAVTAAISESRNVLPELHEKYPGSIRPEITHVGFVQYEGAVYLKTVTLDGQINLADTEFISRGGGLGDYYFSVLRRPDENATLMVNNFAAYSIINCFELFTDEGANAVARAFEANRNDAGSAPGHHGGEDAR